MQPETIRRVLEMPLPQRFSLWQQMEKYQSREYTHNIHLSFGGHGLPDDYLYVTVSIPSKPAYGGYCFGIAPDGRVSS